MAAQIWRMPQAKGVPKERLLIGDFSHRPDISMFIMVNGQKLWSETLDCHSQHQ